MCVQCEKSVQQDVARVLLAAREMKSWLEAVGQQQQQFSDVSPDLDASIPITFTKVRHNLIKNLFFL